MHILVLNAGSSSQKSRLYKISGKSGELPATVQAPIWAADADWSSTPGRLSVTITAQGRTIKQELSNGSHAEILPRILQTLWQGEIAVIQQPGEIDIVGHRIVHGGAHYQRSVLITSQVESDLQQLIPFAPLHQPANLAGIDAVRQLLGDVKQVAVFDTAFHSQLPLAVQLYPGPYAWYEQGIRRYGFHGISHQYCTRRSLEIVGSQDAARRIVICHLGNGCSLAAVSNGHSIDTTMGFTPLEGLMMGTRSGTIDPSILLYLQREQGYNADQLDMILNREAGLKGISGLSGDLRQILQASDEGNERACLALDMFIYRLRYFIGAMIASLGGIDILTFTGGIGEHSPLVRARVCEGLSFLGLAINDNENATVANDQDIATGASLVRVLVVHTEEDWEIARECVTFARPRP